jgi:DNA replication protein DnaC
MTQVISQQETYTQEQLAKRVEISAPAAAQPLPSIRSFPLGAIGQYIKYPALVQQRMEGKKCLVCWDNGEIEERKTVQFYYAVTDGGKYTGVEILIKGFCVNCDEGLVRLNQWQLQKDGCPHCYKGVRLNGDGTPTKPLTFCGCATGDGRIAEIKDIWKREHALNQEDTRNRVAKSDLPEDYREFTFDNFSIEAGELIKPEEAQQLTYAFERVSECARNLQNCYLCAPTGAGKTHLAVAYLNFAFTDHGVPAAKFITMERLMRSLRKTINGEGDLYSGRWDSLLDTYINAPLLILDDLGQEKASDKVSETVFALINDRIEAHRPTVITSNNDPRKFYGSNGRGSGRYSDGAISRMLSFELVSWDVDDYRAKIRERLNNERTGS